jgi:hypothetical protein
LLHEFLPRVSSETKDFFKELLPTWKYAQYTCTFDLLASDARAARDKGRLIEAFDLYKKIKNFYHKIIDYARSEKLDPVYERTAISNYLGAMTNDTKTFGRVILSKGVIKEGSSDLLLPKEDAVELIRSALEASQLSRRAFRNNPEREQHLEVARVCIRNIQNFFKDNKSFWLDFYIEFENEILKLMKMVDLELFKQIEAKRFLDVSGKSSVVDENKSNKEGQYDSEENLLNILMIIIQLTFGVKNTRLHPGKQKLYKSYMKHIKIEPRKSVKTIFLPNSIRMINVRTEV